MAEDKTGGEDQDDSQGQTDTQTVEQRLSKLERMLADTAKALDEERKASAGKDRKITELADAKRKLEESTLSKDKLLEIREQEQKEREAEWEAKNAAERAELERARVELLKHKVIERLENFPPSLASYVTGNTEEDIEANARNLMKMVLKERDKVTNAAKVTGRPKSGDGKQVGKTPEDIGAMSAREKAEWAAHASEEEFAAVFDEMHSG